MTLRQNADGTVGFACDRCGAIAAGDGLPLPFATADEATIVAQRDGWILGGHLTTHPAICPPCRARAGQAVPEGGAP